VVPFTWTIYIKEKQYHFSIWKNVDPLTIYFPLSIIFCCCSYIDEIHLSVFVFVFFLLGAKCQEQFDIFEKQNCKRVCDEWWMMNESVFICLSKCKFHVVAKFICFENPSHPKWCKEIIKSWLYEKKYKKW